MKKNGSLKLLLSLLFCYAVSSSYAQTGGFEKCTALSKVLSNASVKQYHEAIVYNESNTFPYNIIVTFDSNEEKKSSAYDKNNNQLSELTIALRTEDFYDKPEEVKNLCHTLSSIRHRQKINLIFTYGDIFEGPSPSVKYGTEAYTERLSDALSVNAVTVSLSERNRVIPGTTKGSSPTYISKAATEAFRENGMNAEVAGGLITFLYKKNTLKTDQRANLFAEAGCKSIAVEFSNKKEVLSKIPDYFEAFIPLYESPDISVLDSHSNHVAAEEFYFALSERTSVILYVLTAFLSLFALSELSFLNRKTREKLTEDVLKLWYIIPLSVLLTTVSFFISQNIALFFYNIFSANIYIQISLKVILGFVLASLVFLAAFKVQGLMSSSAYSYLVTISGIINLVVFTAIDISLFYLFAIEYILIYISRPVKHTASLLTCFFLLFVPFIPYSIQIIKFTKPSSLPLLVHSSFGINTLISIGLLPFEIQWLRILVRLNERWKKANAGTKKFYIQNIITFSVAFIIFLVISMSLDFLIPEKYKNPGNKKEVTLVEKGDSALLSANLTELVHYGEKTRILNISCPKNTRRVHVQVRGKTSNSVLYSDNDFVQDKSNLTDIFKLPLYPPQKIQLRYIAKAGEESTVKIICEVEAESESLPYQRRLILLTKEIFIP